MKLSRNTIIFLVVAIVVIAVIYYIKKRSDYYYYYSPYNRRYARYPYRHHYGFPHHTRPYRYWW